MEKKISIFVISAVAVFIGLFTAIWTSLVLTFILPTTNTSHDTVSDTVIAQSDTLSFDEEMAIADSIIRVYDDSSFSLSDIPRQEIYNGEENRIQQTIISYPNGMPKITVKWVKDSVNPDRYIMEKILYFYDDTGYVANGYGLHRERKWECINYKLEKFIIFTFSNPNVCRNILHSK